MEAGTLKELCERLGFALDASQVALVKERLERNGPLEVDMAAAMKMADDPVVPFPLGAPGEFTVQGTVARGYESVERAFRDNFAQGLERNSQLCVYKDGKIVVDLCGSNAALSTTDDYNADTLQIVFSSTKAVTSAVFALAADRGVLNYDDKVSTHWPEFAAGGKDSMTVADVLRHDAGMASFSETISREAVLDQYNLDGEMARIIAAQQPWSYSDGPAKGQTPRLYHGISRGYILNQILMRADPKGRSMGKFLAEEISGPLECDVFCGPHHSGWLEKPRAVMRGVPNERLFNLLTETIPNAIRVSLPDSYPWLTPPVGMDRGSMRDFIKGPYWKLQPQSDNQGMTKGAWFSDAEEFADLEAPSASGRASARGLAKIMAMLAGRGEVDGVRLMSQEGVAAAISGVVHTRERGDEDLVNPVFPLGVVGGTGFTNAGWYATTDEHRNVPEPPPPGAYGWAGAGGSSLWFDPVKNIGYAYTITGRRTPCGTQLGGSTERVLNLLSGLLQSAAYKSESETSKL